jgi:hypothetical protein
VGVYVWVLYCVLVLVKCVLGFTVFCIVCTVFFALFRLCKCFLVLCVLVATKLQLVIIIIIIIITLIIIIIIIKELF